LWRGQLARAWRAGSPRYRRATSHTLPPPHAGWQPALQAGHEPHPSPPMRAGSLSPRHFSRRSERGTARQTPPRPCRHPVGGTKRPGLHPGCVPPASCWPGGVGCGSRCSLRSAGAKVSGKEGLAARAASGAMLLVPPASLPVNGPALQARGYTGQTGYLTTRCLHLGARCAILSADQAGAGRPGGISTHTHTTEKEPAARFNPDGER
jgi:hypothetical protein